MLFKPEHVDMIMQGIKTATRRAWKRPMAKPGGLYPVQVRMFQRRAECPLIRVTRVYRQRLGDMTEEDARKEGGYTLDEFRDVWIGINGAWDDDQMVYVVEFRYQPRIIEPQWRER